MSVETELETVRRELAEVRAELAAARREQAASAEVLKVIGHGEFDLDALVSELVDSARRLCQASVATISLVDGEFLRFHSVSGGNPAFEAFLRDHPFSVAAPDPSSNSGRILLTGAASYIRDIAAEPGFDFGEGPRLGNIRSLLGAPLLRAGKVIGVFQIGAPEPDALTSGQIELVQNFADHAVVAIENARLLHEVRARTRDLEEALAQQTATAEVLKVISRSPTDLQPVLDAIVETARLLCRGSIASISLVEGDVLRFRGLSGGNPAFEAFRRAHSFPVSAPDPANNAGRVLLTGAASYIRDAAVEPGYDFGEGPKLGNFRSLLGVPLLRDGKMIGVFQIGAPEPDALTPRQIELVQSFADQAVIAIENARLFDEVQARTRDMEEALERQSATSKILEIIASSPSDAGPVFRAIATSANAVVRGYSTAVWRFVDGFAHLVAFTPTTPEGNAALEALSPSPLSDLAPFVLTEAGESLAVEDTEAESTDPIVREVARRRGFRSMLFTPLTSRGAVLGFISVTRLAPGAFAPKDLALLRAFADQAVIAIENARLFNETQEALRQQTATADVLKAISRSVFDPQTVLEALINSAVSLSGSTNGGIWQYENGAMQARAFARGEGRADFIAYMQAHPQRPGRGSAVARVASTSAVQNIADAREDPEFSDDVRRTVENLAMLGVPMKRGDELVGAIVMSKPEAGAYPERIVELVKTFADQAVIAIENARLFEEVKAKTRDLEEALAQQTATADVLKTISRSAFDLQVVLDTLVESASKLCGVSSGLIFLRDGETLQLRSAFNAQSDPVVEALKRNPQSAGRGTISSRVLQTGQIQNVADVRLDPEYDPAFKQAILVRALLGVPLKRDDVVVGAFVLRRSGPGLFDARHVGLVESFADQAVIAIENSRLFEEVKARTRDLEEALALQTATADVLKIISHSVSDAAPVFEAILESCQRLFGLEASAIYLVDGDMAKGVARRGWSYGDWGADVLPLAGSTTGLAIAERRPVHFPDLADKPDLPERFKIKVRETGGMSVLYAPMLVEAGGVGSIVVSRKPARPFSDKEIALLQSFADQAAIAIRNARLFEEVQARTRDLEEALAQQTATANALQIISRSAFGLHEVMQTLIDSAVALCADDGVVYLRKGDIFLAEAAHDSDEEKIRARNQTPRAIGRDSVTGRVAMTGEVQFIPDNEADPDFKIPQDLRLKGIRSLVGVPLLRDGEVTGVFVLGKKQTGAFGRRAVEVVKTFADQAVIVIENVRLFDEVQAKTRDLEESLAQQTATADVLKVISSSAFDLQKVLDTLTESARRLCGANYATVHMRDGRFMRLRAHSGCSDEFVAYLESTPIDPETGRGGRTHVGMAVRTAAPVEVPDTDASDLFRLGEAPRLGNFRSVVGVPLRRDRDVEGVFSLARQATGSFTARQIDLLETFADQAVIAVENSRLFAEVQAKTRDLEASLAQQTATADVLKVISRSAFDLDAIFQTLVTTAVDLCKASSGTLCVRDGDVFRYRGMAGPEANAELQRYLTDHPLVVPTRSTIAGRAILSRQTEKIADVLIEEDYAVPFAAHGSPARSLLSVPLLSKSGVQGAIVVARAEPGDFPPRHIEILRTFADQAVIAIENARLFEQVQARTRELEQSLADLRGAQQRLVQSEKLASLGQLTAGIAHEIKNPLNFVNNFAALSRELFVEMKESLATASLPEDSRADVEELTSMLDSNLEKVVHHGKRADSIVKNMLLHSREGSGERTRVNVNAMVEEALNLGYHGARAEKPGFNVTIEKSLDSQAGVADLYLQEITRVLLNLISNGFYATAKRVQSEGGEYQPTLTASTRSLGANVEIRIRDNGTGIPSEVRDKMFNPFFTTKPAGEGTGLGLSLSYDIVVKQHGGSIEVDTAPGAFTEFVITLPRDGAKA